MPHESHVGKTRFQALFIMAPENEGKNQKSSNVDILYIIGKDFLCWLKGIALKINSRDIFDEIPLHIQLILISEQSTQHELSVGRQDIKNIVDCFILELFFFIIII